MRHGCLITSALATARPPLVFAATMPAPCDRSAVLDAWSPRGYRNGSLTGAPVLQPEFGDCTVAALAHHAQLVSMLDGHAILTPPEAPIIKQFAAIAGLPPGATDDQIAAVVGLDPVAVLDWTEAHGFDVGQQVPLVPRPATVDITDRFAMAHGIDRGRGLWAAFALYQADEEAFASGAVLDTLGPPGGAVGGHMMVLADFPAGLADGDLIGVVTYDSAAVNATWRWVMDRVRGAFVVGWEAPV